MSNKFISFTLILAICLCLFSSCSSEKEENITDSVNIASKVLINGKNVDTVEASVGAFEGEAGDYIEFIFPQEQEINTVYIIEKTATVRQFNIYAKTSKKYELVYTGKNIFNENIQINTVKATALKVEIVNTQIGNEHFIIQGISAYNINDK